MMMAQWVLPMPNAQLKSVYGAPAIANQASDFRVKGQRAWARGYVLPQPTGSKVQCFQLAAHNDSQMM